MNLQTSKAINWEKTGVVVMGELGAHGCLEAETETRLLSAWPSNPVMMGLPPVRMHRGDPGPCRAMGH